MTTTETCHYRGYDIVPTRLWSSWCVGVYRTRADIPLMAQSTLNTFAPRMEEAVDEAKQSIDRALDNRRPDEKGTSARIASCFLRRFGLAEIPDVPPSSSRTTILGSPDLCGVRGFFFLPTSTQAEVDVWGRGFVFY